MKIKVITDSSCDLPPNLMREYDIESLPLDLTMNGKKVTLSSREIIEMMNDGKDVKTSQVTPLKFQRAYEEALKEYDGILSVHLSSKLSGTYRSALLAAREVDEKRIEVVDSKSTSAALGILVLKAHELSRTFNLEESARKLRKLSENVETIFGIKVIDNLVKGGRAAPLTGKLMNLMNAKPVLRGINGEIKLYKVTLGFRRVLKEMIKFIKEREILDKKIVIAHVEAEQEVEYLRSNIDAEVISCEAGPVITIHGGWGFVLAGFIRK